MRLRLWVPKLRYSHAAFETETQKWNVATDQAPLLEVNA